MPINPPGIIALGLLCMAMMGCGETVVAREVSLVLGPLPSAILSVAEANGTLWVVGADDTSGAFLAARSAGTDRFERVDLRSVDPLGGDLWWVHTTDKQVVAVGERGRFFVVDDGVSAIETGTTVPLYGVAGDEVFYAVGGPPATIVRVADGVATTVPLPEGAPTDVRLFKVHDDGERLHIVGERGTHLIVDHDVVTYAPVPGKPRLVTVHGPPGNTLAVGGESNAYAVLLGDLGARLLPPGPVAPLSGVFVGKTTLATGFLGLLLERRGDGWRKVAGLPTTFDGHAVHIDNDGVGWVAGGRLLDGSMSAGMLWRVGPGSVDPGDVSTLDVSGEVDSVDSVGEVDIGEVESCATLGLPAGLELGTRDMRGCFARYEEGAEATIINGPQGGSHVEVSLRFAGIDNRIDLSLSLVVEGTTIARFEAVDFPTEVDPDGARLTTDLPVIFAGADASAWVGKTAVLEASMIAAGQRHEAQRSLVLIR